jgi:hypothetical protein
VFAGGTCVRRGFSPEDVSVGFSGGEVFLGRFGLLLVPGFLSGRRARRVFFYTAFLLSFSFPSPSLKFHPLQAFIGSPTHPRLKDHLRCLAAAAGRTGVHLLGDERSGNFWQDQSASERTYRE